MTGVGDGSTRRSVLRTAVVGSGVVGLAGRGRAATTFVSGGGNALQRAIDGASDGDRIVVTDSATYHPVTVDVRVRIDARQSPTVVGAGGTGSAVSIESDGVRFRGFRVTNPGGLLGIKVEREADDVTIRDNTVEDVGPTGRLGVTGIIVGQGDHDGIAIRNNTIRRLDQETTAESGFPTVNGVLFDADNDDPGTVSNTVVAGNRISEVESDVAPLGVVIQHAADGVRLIGNEIRNLTAADGTDSDPSDSVDFGFTFAQGINVASPETTDVAVVRNVISDVTSAETIFPEAVKIEGDGGGVRFRANQFLAAVGLNNRNGTDGGSRDPSTDPRVDAKANYWGSPRGPETADFNTDSDGDSRADVIGNVDADPFLPRPPGPGGGGGGPP